LLRRHTWLIPLLLALLIAGLGRATYLAVGASIREQVGSGLTTILAAEVAALEIWNGDQLAIGRDVASDREAVSAVVGLVSLERGEDITARVASSPHTRALTLALLDKIRIHHFTGYRVVAPDLICLGSSDAEALGQKFGVGAEYTDRVLAGEALITQPLASRDEESPASPRGIMALLVPVRDDSDQVIAMVALGIDAARSFSRLLEAARTGASGETYVFSRDARMLSVSRFEGQLREIGLLPDDPAVGSFMNVLIRDPGGDLAAGFTPLLPPLSRPLTRMAESAVLGGTGADLDGYRDYRGVLVVGAWTFVEELGLGIATEIDILEAYAGLRALRARFAMMTGLLAVTALVMFVYSALLSRTRDRMERAQELGRYRVEHEIGRGGMGTVYKASHALLRRPTAIKLLRREQSTPKAIARFEREVQACSALEHPNTIAIYDYGQTPDGLFYYAMEYLEGVTLDACIDYAGALPDARVLRILEQIAGSIAEAHERGLIHRDLKPGNVMLCDRGGLPDFVKVLDFGLVRSLQREGDVALTDVHTLTGTPRYMPPEAIDSPARVDARSDLYQIGAIGYFLLTGRHVFDGDTLVEVLEQHVNVEPQRPSEVLGHPVLEPLEELILTCLSKTPDDRPENAGVLLAALRAIEVPTPWTDEDAAAWWDGWRRDHPETVSDPHSQLAPPTAPVDIGRRLRHDRS
jgi:hypothetical protein